MPSYNPNKSCEEKGVGLDELLPSMEALEIIPLLSVSSQSARFFWQTSLSIDSKSRVRFEIELFNGKDGGVIFREMTSTLLFPFDLDGSEGGREGDLHRGRCHGKTRNITGFCRMWSWIILSCVKYLQTGLQDVVVRP